MKHQHDDNNQNQHHSPDGKSVLSIFINRIQFAIFFCDLHN
tara:strand:+ start:155 stop:277 length:123 start_codon:yes stop_codon:yes gene_type:complete